MAKNKSLSGAGNYGASIGQGASIADMAYGKDASAPSQHDNDAELYSSFEKAFSAPGDRPRGIWRNFGAGLAKGAAHNARSKAIDEKQGKNEKFQKIMEYYEQANQSAIEQNQWYEKRESAKKEMMPQVLAYMDNIDRLDPQSQRIMAQDMLAQYGEALDENFKLSSIDGSNPFLMTIQSDKGQQLFDLRSMFAGDEAIQQSIAMKMPEYQMKLQEERGNKQREFDMKEKELKAKYPNYGKEDMEGGAGQSEGQTLDVGGHSYKVGELSRVEKTARSKYQEKVYKDVDAIPKNNQSIEAIETMREVFDRNPNIGSSFINMLDSPDGVDSWWNLAAKKLAGPDLADMEILKKATNDLNLDTILGITGKAATDLLKKAVQAASPSGKLTKKGFDLNASKWEKKAREANELAVAKYDAMQKGLSLVATPRGLSTAGAKTPGSMEGDATPEDSPFGTRWKKVQ